MTTLQVAVIVAAVLLGATIKSIAGLGLPIIAIPLISLVAPPELAIAVVALPNAVQNASLVVSTRRHRVETIGLGRFVLVGVLGAGAGALMLGVFSEQLLLATLLVVVGMYLATSIVSPHLGLDRRTALRWAPAAGFVGGFFQGSTGISGPIVGTWHHALDLTRGAFVLSVAASFLLSGTTQVIVLLATGLLDGRLLISGALSLLVLATVPLGHRLRERMSGVGFDRAVIALLSVSALALAVDLVRVSLR